MSQNVKIMKIKDLPRQIKELALKRQVEQGNEPNEELDLIENKGNGNFMWDKTPERDLFWCKINLGNFKPFYDIYPQDVDTSTENVDTCKDKYVQSVIDNFKNRSELGIFKYGTTLERKDLNVHDWLIHLQEELMDAVLYIERLKSEEL